MKICTRCVLPETFPGIVFDEKGVCNYCRRHFQVSTEKKAQQKKVHEKKFLQIVQKLKGKNPYDALMAFSGGKDSTYSLQYLVENLGLRVLAYTFDHGFISPRAKVNMLNVTRNLGVDHVYFLPNPKVINNAFKISVEKEVYTLKTLERASSICNTCMYTAKSVILKAAIEKHCGIIAYGWSPGQAPVQSSVMRLNASMIEKTQEMMIESLSRIMGDDLAPYVLDETHLDVLRAADRNEFGYYNAHPLAFLEYDEGKILHSINQLGWEAPRDTDPNSSNCLLNTFANQVHLEHYGFHPYAMENAGLVRDGCLDREEALERLNTPMDQSLSADIKKALDIT